MKIQAPRLLDLFLDAVPHLEYRSIQYYYPRNFVLSELSRRGVIDYAGNLFTPNYF